AEVVYDLFHVVARYARDVIDRIRVEQANLLREDKPARKAVKQSRWLLLRNRENLNDGQAVQLQELLAENQPLATVYVIKDALKDVWYDPRVREGWRSWRTWLRHARERGLAPLQRLARNMRKSARGLLARHPFPMATGAIAGG
ncbi:transposase, partial [Pseudomonas aeruginosa]